MKSFPTISQLTSLLTENNVFVCFLVNMQLVGAVRPFVHIYAKSLIC